MTKQIETIDITPKWEGLILPMLQAFEDTNNMEVRKDIIDQLTKLAKTVDNLEEGHGIGSVTPSYIKTCHINQLKYLVQIHNYLAGMSRSSFIELQNILNEELKNREAK